MKTALAVAVVAVVVLAACAGGPPARSSALAAPAVAGTMVATRTIEMHRSPTCQCCKAWAEQMRAGGWTVSSVEESDMATFKRMHGVPVAAQSCHTSLVAGYVIEGHVPIAALERLITTRPALDGLAVPGMPEEAPGMGGPSGPVSVMSLVDGSVNPFGVY